MSLKVVGDEVTYMACQVCSKKMTKPDGSERWYCDKCHKEVDDTCDRYLVRVEAREGTTVVPMTCFDTVGRALFEMSAQELLGHDTENETKYDDAVDAIETYRYIIKCSGKIVKLEKGERIDFQVLDVLMKELIPDEERERLGIEDGDGAGSAGSNAETTLESEEERGEKDDKEDEMWEM